MIINECRPNYRVEQTVTRSVQEHTPLPQQSVVSGPCTSRWSPDLYSRNAWLISRIDVQVITRQEARHEAMITVNKWLHGTSVKYVFYLGNIVAVQKQTGRYSQWSAYNIKQQFHFIWYDVSEHIRKYVVWSANTKRVRWVSRNINFWKVSPPAVKSFYTVKW